MGWVERGDLPSEFESAIFRLNAGETSPVIAAEEGFLIFKVEERAAARELTVEQAEPEIRRRLLREKADAYLQGLVASARRGGRVQGANLQDVPAWRPGPALAEGLRGVLGTGLEHDQQ